MALTREDTINRYIVQGGTTKPTSASEAALGKLPIPHGSTCWDATAGVLYKTYDGTNWVAYATNSVIAGNNQIFQKAITSFSDAGAVTVATVTAQDCDIKDLSVRSNGATTANLTSIAVTGGAGNVITFINATDGVRANIAAADQQVAWQSNGGVVTLAATRTIVITLVGSGHTAVDLTVTIEYSACTSGGYLV
jgi:hypothetical protein